MFLMIENQGVANVQAFTVLGLSTARGKGDKIGQFGSGSKHGILTCLRQGINPKIYLGEKQLEFSTRDDKMGETAFKQVVYTFDGTTKDLNISLEFGAMDWKGLEMGLREFVSNAIDAGEYKVDVVNDIQPEADKTRIFLPFNPGVSKFYGDLQEKFLHFSPAFKPENKIIHKEGITTVKNYRKGVWVNDGRMLSHFNYNFGDETPINESRVMSDWDTKFYSGKLWVTAEQQSIEQLLKKINEITDKHFENDIQFSCHYYDIKSEHRTNWKNAWHNIYGDAVPADSVKQINLAQRAAGKGVKVVAVPPNLMDLFIRLDFPTVTDKVDNVDKQGREVTPANAKIIAHAQRVWNKLESAQLTRSKPFPKVNVFTMLMDGGQQINGFYNSDNKSINLEKQTGINSVTILEELGHYITESDDNSRDFQEFFIRCAVHFMKV